MFGASAQATEPSHEQTERGEENGTTAVNV